MSGAGQNVPGANYWRQGADTCVLDRAVGCFDNNAVKREELEGYVSRIVPKCSDDAAIEATIADWFPDLVEKGLVAVSKVQCTPKFLDQNLQTPFKKGPCSKVVKNAPAQYVNLITKKYDTTFAEYVNDRLKKEGDSFSLQERFEILRGLINALVRLTDDTKPTWVIHTDIHSNNILIDETKQQSALADFGRIILIEDINNPTKLYEGLQNYLKLMREKVTGFSFAQDFLGMTLGNYLGAYQKLKDKIESGNLLEKEKNELLQLMQDVKNVLRLWPINQVLNRESLIKGLEEDDEEKVDSLRNAINEATDTTDLIRIVDSFLVNDLKIGYEYINNTNYNLGGGRRKYKIKQTRIRKQKRKQRKTKKHK